MIRLTSFRQAQGLRERIPDLAILRMEQFEGKDGQYDPERHGYILVFQEGDTSDGLPELGNQGLLSILDPESPGYEYVEAFTEGGKRVIELVIQFDDERTLAVIIPDEPWLDPKISRALREALPESEILSAEA